MIKILRPTRETPFISANIFEELFTNQLGDIFDLRREPLIPWCNKILGESDTPYPFPQVVQKFYQSTKDFDYFCPGYECIPLSPLFLALRNSSKANLRLLFIAHAPGAFVLEWVLLKPLLVPGDIIIAPSKSAKAVITLLCPELTPFIRVIPHPMKKLPPPSTSPEHAEQQRLVTLSRICETKLIHRQIEAMAILQKRGHHNVKMDIAGSLNVDDDPSKKITQYARSLQAKIKRLGLDNTVHLVGPILGEYQKSHFLSGARASVNLSVSLEEAFPKASVEPLGLGIPIIATHWNGFIETVGNAGKFVPVIEVSDGILDVDAKEVADAIEEALNITPSAETCIKQAERFIPAIVRAKYRTALQEGMQYQPSEEIQADTFAEYDGGASDSQGILGEIAVLQYFSWKEVLGLLLTFSKKIRQTWEGNIIEDFYEGEILRNLLLFSTKAPIEYFHAGIEQQKETRISEASTESEHHVQQCSQTRVQKPKHIENLDFAEKIAQGIQTNALISSKDACLLSLSKGNQVDLLEKNLFFLEENGEFFPGTYYYRIELECLKGNYSTAYELFAQQYPVGSIKEHEPGLLRQIAKICRKWKKPELALSWLRAWLNSYPDSPGSGVVWLDCSANAYYVGDKYMTEAQEAVKMAEDLLGDLPVIRKLQQNIFLETVSEITA